MSAVEAWGMTEHSQEAQNCKFKQNASDQQMTSGTTRAPFPQKDASAATACASPSIPTGKNRVGRWARHNSKQWLHIKGHILHQCGRSCASSKHPPNWVCGFWYRPPLCALCAHRAHTVLATPPENHTHQSIKQKLDSNKRIQSPNRTQACLQPGFSHNANCVNAANDCLLINQATKACSDPACHNAFSAA